MEKSTIEKLVNINSVFYQKLGEHFDSSRNYFWDGWNHEKLDSAIRNFNLDGKKLKILDLGCGNARFLEFMVKHHSNIEFDYTGIDMSDTLIEKAKDRIKKFKRQKEENWKVLNLNFIFDNWEDKLKEGYDLVLMFGLMHHIPGKKRKELVENVSRFLDEKSLLVITTWQFVNTSRLHRRIVLPENEEGQEIFKKLNLDPGELEENDFILDWQRVDVGYRYCHNTTDEELKGYLEALGLKVVTDYYSDGKEGDVNRYYIIQKI